LLADAAAVQSNFVVREMLFGRLGAVGKANPGRRGGIWNRVKIA